MVKSKTRKRKRPGDGGGGGGDNETTTTTTVLWSGLIRDDCTLLERLIVGPWLSHDWKNFRLLSSVSKTLCERFRPLFYQCFCDTVANKWLNLVLLYKTIPHDRYYYLGWSKTGRFRVILDLATDVECDIHQEGLGHVYQGPLPEKIDFNISVQQFQQQQNNPNSVLPRVPLTQYSRHGVMKCDCCQRNQWPQYISAFVLNPLESYSDPPFERWYQMSHHCFRFPDTFQEFNNMKEYLLADFDAMDELRKSIRKRMPGFEYGGYSWMHNLSGLEFALIQRGQGQRAKMVEGGFWARIPLLMLQSDLYKMFLNTCLLWITIQEINRF